MRVSNAFLLTLTFFVFLFPLGNSTWAQKSSPKREFRGIWIATVANIDFPSAGGLSTEKFKAEWIARVDALQNAGFNTLVVQIRPAGDAFYYSKISPWSKFLSGQQGLEPPDGFDPLVFMIETAHNRNLDFHAWLNSYRAAMDTITLGLAPAHPYKQHPEWFVQYGGRLYFNPALPAVRNYITEVVMELITEYDVDAIHFDDYFYPYPSGNAVFPDAEDFANFGYGHTTIASWRRSNVDKLISQISQMLKTFAPHVKFGISPFGVWRNTLQDPLFGSSTRTTTNSFDDLNADVRGWLEKGWIDYVAPQLYWNIGFQVADYETLVSWWAKNSFGRRLFIGQAAYKVNNSPEEAWKNPGEIPRQIQINRSFPEIGGSIFFNASSLLRNPLGLLDSLSTSYYSNKALWPEMPYLELPASLAPNLDAPRLKGGKLSFRCSLDNKDENAAYLVIYRFEDRLPGDFNNPENIFPIYRLNGKKSLLIEDTTVEVGKIYTYSASTANRQYTESILSNWRTVNIGAKKLLRVK